MSCPFLKRATLAQLKNSNNQVLAGIAKKCPVASTIPVQKYNIPAVDASSCPYSSKDRRNDRELKHLASKCCPFQNAELMQQKRLDEPVSKVTSCPKISFMGEVAGEALRKKEKDNTYRIFKEISRSAQIPGKCSIDNHLAMKVNWSSNDYLGLSQHPRVINSTIEVISETGVGAGGTRNISGTSPYHHRLETALADWHYHQHGLVFSSCYVANENVIAQIAELAVKNGKKLHIISDEKNHASMIQGVLKACRTFPGYVEKSVFKHNDMDDLEAVLQSSYSDEIVPLILFESVYSMEGDFGLVDEISVLSKKYDALTFCDEVHAVGLYGENGHGLCNPEHEIDFITGTLGKALGSLGGYVTSNNADFIEYFRLHCPGLIFTTSLPPAICQAAWEGLQISCSVEGENLRNLHQKNVAYMKTLLLDYFPDHEEIFEKSNHIIPVFINDAKKVDLVQRKMLRHDHYCQAINSPTVPKGSERLRIVVTPQHDQGQIQRFVRDLVDSIEEVNAVEGSMKFLDGNNKKSRR